ncbi:cell division protein FtsQ/DivIB [Rickettsia endosymbiont of Cardiosporidium cionae]|uniref:cell division protein FtsQ/DivIB n=1 Tax=Rickettsia endosymbiont of Cardiosporidium cionae TaxID=2777155 RepID=UPI001895C89C|nr:FtsQ-type POTRA domain-containing protein [Rickettsia endosymbiont of Cardiosporidium cionae]
MNKTNRLKHSKDSISFIRSLYSFYYKIKFFLLLVTITIICLSIFTDIFDNTKKSVINYLNILSYKYGFKIQFLIIEGQKNITDKELLGLFKNQTQTSILNIDLENIRACLEKNAFIKHAIIERRLPNTIHIAITEKSPVAIWQYNNSINLVDDNGEIIYVKNIEKYIEKYSNLIHIIGKSANIEVTNLINDLKIYPSIYQKLLYATRYGERRWDLILEQNITVKMPEKNFKNAYIYIYKLYKNSKLFESNYKILDLRNSNKYYIEYKK